MTYSHKHIALICNPAQEAEKALRLAQALVPFLKERNVPHRLFTSQWPEDLEGFTEAWILGGDGTLNFFINRFPHINLPLSVFRGGSGNDFHWMLYGDTALIPQAELVLSGTPRRVDAGVCNNRIFLNGVGIGFDGAIVKDLLGKKKLGGKGSYLLSILKNIVGYHEQPFVIETPSQRIEKDCFLISVANGRRYGGGFMVAPKASVTDGLLDVNLVGRIKPLQRIRYLPVIEKDEHLDLPFVHYSQAHSVVITCPYKVPAHIDGEYEEASRFEISLLPDRFSFIY